MRVSRTQTTGLNTRVLAVHGYWQNESPHLYTPQSALNLVVLCSDRPPKTNIPTTLRHIFLVWHSLPPRYTKALSAVQALEYGYADADSFSKAVALLWLPHLQIAGVCHVNIAVLAVPFETWHLRFCPQARYLATSFLHLARHVAVKNHAHYIFPSHLKSVAHGSLQQCRIVNFRLQSLLNRHAQGNTHLESIAYCRVPPRLVAIMDIHQTMLRVVWFLAAFVWQPDTIDL